MKTGRNKNTDRGIRKWRLEEVYRIDALSQSRKLQIKDSMHIPRKSVNSKSTGMQVL